MCAFTRRILAVPTMLFVLITAFSFSSALKNEDIAEERDVSEIYRTVMCAAVKTTGIQIELEDLYAHTDPLAPDLQTKWRTDLSITSTSERAKYFFNQGLFHLYAFNHEESDRSFKEAIRQDSTCAMCHWGVAIGLGPNINMPMLNDNNADALKYSQKAWELSKSTSAEEKALIYALKQRYSADTLIHRKALDSIYADEMRLVSQRFRESMDIATLFVESLMNCMPWQYWHPDDTPKLRTREALAVLDYIAEKDPSHPGANHYYIHVVEEVHPSLGVQSADKLAEMHLTAGHLVHMPSHIYIQTGRYHEAVVANEKAIDADEVYFTTCKDQDIYPAIYYPHNIHFLSFAASMEGSGKSSIESARKLVEKTPKNKLSTFRSLEQYLPMPYLSLVRFKKWNEIIEEPKPQVNYLYATLIWHYARGMAYANIGEVKKAELELENIEKIRGYEAYKNLHSAGFPTLSIADMTTLVLQSEIEGIKGNYSKKVQLLTEAVSIQDGLFFVEIPHMYYPIRQSLGAALLENKNAKEAETVYREDLMKFPDNGWSLHGLHESLIQQGKIEAAKAVKDQLEAAWSYADIDAHPLKKDK